MFFLYMKIPYLSAIVSDEAVVVIADDPTLQSHMDGGADFHYNRYRADGSAGTKLNMSLYCPAPTNVRSWATSWKTIQFAFMTMSKKDM